MKAMIHDVDRVNLKLLKTAIRFNARILGLTAGSLAAVVIYIVTQTSIVKWGDDSGGYLGLLAIFFPGYSVSSAGAWIGAFWAFIYFGTCSWLSYRVYGKVLGTRISALLLSPVSTANPVLKRIFENCVLHDTPLHLLGLLSNGNIHSHVDHSEVLIRHAFQAGIRRCYLHALLDGRDVGVPVSYTHLTLPTIYSV